MGVAVFIATPVEAQVTCLKQFDQIICSDGRNAIINGDTTIWSDGSSVYRPYPDQIFINPPADSSSPPPPLITRPRR